MKNKRNHDKHTDQSTMKLLILKALVEYGAVTTATNHYLLANTLGYAAYPGYNFKNPQAAAFAVAMVKRQLMEDEYIWRRKHGYYITFKGERKLAEMEAAAQQQAA